MPSQTEMSMQAFEEKLKDKPKSLVFSRLADSYRKSGDVQQAITICSEGLKLHPDYITGRIILGRCFLEQENFNDAIKEFSKVCKQDRRNQIAIKMLADIFSKQGMEEKAGDLYNLLLKMDPDNPSVVHLANIFKGSNKENLFEILGIEEDITVEKKEEDQAELEEALDELESEDIDQEVEASDVSPEEAVVTESVEEDLKTPELTSEEETAISELVGEDIEVSETTPEEEATITESGEVDLKTHELTTEEEAAVSELVGEDIEATELATKEEGVAAKPTGEELKTSEVTSEDDVAVAESLEEELKEIGVTTEEEPVAAETEVTHEDTVTATPEEEKEAAATLEAITEDLEIPDLETVKEVQADATPEEEPSLDEILSPEGDLPSDAPPTKDITIEEEPAAELAEDIAVESGEITELKEEKIEIEEIEEKTILDKAEADETITIEELTDQKPEKDVEPTPVTAKRELPTKKADDELPGGDDISARMGSMFGEEVEELGADIAETAVTEKETPAEKKGTAIPAAVSEDTPASPEVTELSSRIEDMFGDEGEAGEPVEEIAVPTEDVLADIDLTSAPTATIDKDILDNIREADIDITEEAEEEISELEDLEPELLGISEEVTVSIEDISEEKEAVRASTEVIDIEDTKTELVEEPPDMEEVPALFDEETYDKLVIDHEEKEDITDSMVTEATAVFDKDTIGRLAAADVDELDEALDTPVRKTVEDTSSVSGADVFSRLDEMFPTETTGKPVEAITGETKEIAREPVLEEPIASIDMQEKLPDKQTESISMDTVDSEEQPSGKDIESRIDEMFIEDELLEGVSLDSIPDEEIEESTVSGDYYTESGHTATLEDDEVIMEASEDIPIGSDTVALNISPAEEMAVVEDEIELSEFSIDSIPDEDIDEGDSTGEISLEEIDKIPIAGDAESFDLELTEETTPIEDEILEADSAIDSIPDEDFDESEATVEFYTESGETALDQNGIVTEEEIEVSEPEEQIQDLPPTGEDVIASLDKIFPEDQRIGDSPVDTIPDEEVSEETTVGDGFYNVSGEEASDAEVDESVLSTLEEDEETFFFESDSSEEVAPDQHIIPSDKDLPPKAESIPDHVLTPTLADIYFQQDQPQLAVQIYKRLLKRDPENEKIADRIKQIEQVIKEKEALIEKTAAEKEKTAKKGKKKKSKTRKKKTKDDKRPLKGIKIRKDIKKRIKRARKELEM